MLNKLMKVLLVEDNTDAANALRTGLSAVSAVDIAPTGTECLAKAQSDTYDLVLLDLGLPDMTGFDVCKKLRAEKYTGPILVVSGQGEIDDKIAALDIGADDYITKPYNLNELQARMRALMRRATGPTKLKVADIELDVTTHIVTRGGNLIKLRRKELELLEYFMRNAGHTVTREMIIQNVWGTDDGIWTNVVDVHIKNLRDKIDRPFNHPLLKTVYGVGYKLETASAAANKKGGRRAKV